MTTNSRKMVRRGVVTLCIATLILFVTPVSAGCLNCDFSTRSEPEPSIDDGTDEIPMPTSGSTRTKIRRLPSNVVEEIFIPILFGVSLRDLYPNFADPRDGGARTHEGFDILAPMGTPIVSPTVAVVTDIGTWSGAGKYVTTANPGGERYVYMHLSAYGEELDEGDVLQAGDLIGYVGDTGNAAGTPHLHWEIRDGRTPLDPYPRITKEFTLTKKIQYLDDILDDARKPDTLAALLVEEFEGTFIAAQLEGVELPRAITKHLSAPIDISSAEARDLTVGDVGADVSILQSLLIQKGYLAITEPTGTFGPLTKTALIAFQQSLGVSPATGYFGPLTRAAMRAQSTGTVASVSSDSDLVAIIKLFLALGIISKDKEAAAYAAIATL